MPGPATSAVEEQQRGHVEDARPVEDGYGGEQQEADGVRGEHDRAAAGDTADLAEGVRRLEGDG